METNELQPKFTDAGIVLYLLEKIARQSENVTELLVKVDKKLYVLIKNTEPNQPEFDVAEDVS